jgi:trimethylamine:corrinoid methyltransferase-like protein
MFSRATPSTATCTASRYHDVRDCPSGTQASTFPENRSLDRPGPRGQFPSEEHTITNLRTGELITTGTFERDLSALWEERGSRSLEQKAREKGQALLAKHTAPPLRIEVRSELAAIVASADRDWAGKS